MQIEINKKEYKSLIKSLYWASAVLKSYRPKMVDKEINEEVLLKRLLGLANQFEMEHCQCIRFHMMYSQTV